MSSSDIKRETSHIQQSLELLYQIRYIYAQDTSTTVFRVLVTMRIITVSGASPTRAQAHPRGYEGYDPTLESGPENQVYDVSLVTLMTIDSKAFLDYVVFVRCFAILWVESRVWQIQKAIISSPMGPDTGSAKLRSDLEPRGAWYKKCEIAV